MRFLRDSSGATSIEYALIAASIFLVVVVAYPAVASNVAAALGRVLPGLQ